MDQNKVNQILRIAKMHFELKMSQVDIATAENLSKSTVSRILKNAMDLGFVEVRVIEPLHSFSDLEAELISRYPLGKAVIVPDIVQNDEILLRDVCTALAEDLPRYIENDSIVGVAWGRTLSALLPQLKPIKRSGVSVIQLNGGFSRVIYESGAMEIIKGFVGCFGSNGHLLPAPAIVDNKEIAAAIRTDSQIDKIFKMAKDCQIAIYSVGNISRKSQLFEMGCFSDKEYHEIEERGATGDVCSHFIDAQGRLADPELDKRVLATPLEDIRAIPNKLLIAVGQEKAAAIRACLLGGLVDVLYIDEPTVRTLLSL